MLGWALRRLRGPNISVQAMPNGRHRRASFAVCNNPVYASRSASDVIVVPRSWLAGYRALRFADNCVRLDARSRPLGDAVRAHALLLRSFGRLDDLSGVPVA